MGVKGFFETCIIMAGMLGIKLTKTKQGKRIHCLWQALLATVNSKHFQDRAESADFLRHHLRDMVYSHHLRDMAHNLLALSQSVIFLTQNYNQGILTAIVSLLGVFLLSFIGVFESSKMESDSIFGCIMTIEAVLFFGKTR